MPKPNENDRKIIEDNLRLEKIIERQFLKPLNNDAPKDKSNDFIPPNNSIDSQLLERAKKNVKYISSEYGNETQYKQWVDIVVQYVKDFQNSPVK